MEALGDTIMWANMLACWRGDRRHQPPPFCNPIPATPTPNQIIIPLVKKQTSPCSRGSLPMPFSDHQSNNMLHTEPIIPNNNKSPSTIGDRQTSPDWSALPQDIWNLILEKLPLEDYIRSGIVCSDWLSHVRPPKHCSTQPRIPWLMIPQQKDTTRWKLFDITNRRKPWRTIHLPELENSLVLGSSESWLVIVDEKTADFRLFNPFTRDHIKLPPTNTLPGVSGPNLDGQGNIISYHAKYGPVKPWNYSPLSFSHCYIKAAFLGSSDCGYTVVVTEMSGRNTAFARVGDKAWTALPMLGMVISEYVPRYTFFKGTFYFISMSSVFSVDLNNKIDSPAIPLQVSPPFPSSQRLGHLVISPESGEILGSVYPWSSDNDDIIHIFKLDRKKGEWVEMHSLYGHPLFFAPWFINCKDTPGSMICLSSKEYPAELKSLPRHAAPLYQAEHLPIFISPLLTHIQ